MSRNAEVERVTKETNIIMKLDLDGEGKSTIDTGIGFFNHMLEGFARHGFFDLMVKVEGDLHVDGHHTIEDTGIVLGQAIREALGDKAGIKRYGSCILPMDDALALCAVDLCGRPYFNYECEYPSERIGGFGYGAYPRIFLCGFLFRRDESAYKDAFGHQQPSYGGSYV